MNSILHFELSEYHERLQNIHRMMELQNIDVLLLSDPCNLFYVMGYDAWSFYVPQCVLVARGSFEPVWIGREMDAGGAGITTYLKQSDIVAYGDEYVQSATCHPASVMAEEILQRFGKNIRLGLELNSYYLGALAHLKLQEHLAGVDIVDASLLVNWVRVKKSPTELGYMHDAAQLVQKTMTAALDMIEPGVRECDAAGLIYKNLMGGTAEFGGNYTSTPPLMLTGERLNTPHLSWTSAPFAADSQVNLELVACRNRYHTPLSRSLYMGEVPAGLLNLEKAIIEGIEASLDFIRPGVRACEVEAAWQTAAAKYNVRKSARCGYSIGIAYPPTFGEQTISLRPEDDTVLEEGMTLHLMPAVWQEGCSIVITEPFVVTKTGCETFCNFPRKLFVKK